MASPLAKKIVIVGGGTAGWMSAAAFARLLPSECKVTLVESQQIGTVGVGEATIPHIRYFNQLLGIPERDFMRETQATYKLAIEFTGWGNASSRYMHPFSAFGADLGGVDFHHHFLTARAIGSNAALDDFSLAAQLARGNRFAPPPDEPGLGYGYAYHLDATAYASFLRRYAEARRVVRREGKVERVTTAPNDGRIAALVLESGEVIEGDLFIDCSGFRSLLLGKTLGVSFESWRQWLPCDRAVAQASEPLTPLPSYTRSRATASGWQWRIPLQHRTGNGQVYSSECISDDEACAQLQRALNSAPLSDPNFIQFEAGYRTHSWEKNCVAIGLSSGFLEPLESTSIYLIQMAIVKLVEFFPDADEHISREAFNRWMGMEYRRVRDFLVLHYHLNRRQDSDFWRYCADMNIPASLQEKIELFRESAVVQHYDQGLFAQPSWLAVYFGQGLVPLGWDSRAASVSADKVARTLHGLASQLQTMAERAPAHAEVLARGGLKREPPAAMNLYGGGRES
ncbi:tryptophan halogenase family protein [Gilvimarinus xylanilyticus]|uniref:Tryptophan 7-halogenase n=1 Tax=Gilvimarinus xylanilyticus TaxID=2944139 RepID=A0A9X2HWX4_9GAMM|nr:tryptophan halogenase family protein [Gilvimarinus xylanilyticus]MCP8899635.1 tryptophan 7-halogenase [Gilvimarinus xylanilyticus]